MAKTTDKKQAKRFKKRFRAGSEEREEVVKGIYAHQNPADPVWSRIYTDEHLEAIVQAIGAPINDIRKYSGELESAAGWFRVDDAGPKRTPISQVNRELSALKKRLDRVLELAEKQDVREAIKTRCGDRNYDVALETLEDFSRWASDAEPTTIFQDFSGEKECLFPAGHVGNQALLEWISRLKPIYEGLTGRSIGASFGSERKEGDRSYGPFVRFIIACAAPLGIRPTDRQARDAVQSLLRRTRTKNLKKRG